MMNKKELSQKIFNVYCALNNKNKFATMQRFIKKAKKEHITTEKYIIDTVVLPANFMMIIEHQMRN